jgi:uncharacterized membrane protein
VAARDVPVSGERPTVEAGVRSRFRRVCDVCSDGHWPLWLLVGFAALVYGSYSLIRDWHFGSGGYDLGLFDQAVWRYSRFEAPVSTVYVAGPTNVLSDHFSPILVILVPFYWLWDSVDVLLIAQAALFASAAVPIWFFVRRRLGVVPAYCFAGAFLAYWGILAATAFDFHEIAFAVPLIAFAILCADEQRWRWFFGCAFCLLLVKEDLAILIAFFGLYLMVKKHRRQGAACVVLGVTAFFLITKLVMPHFVVAGTPIPRGSAQGWSYTQLGKNPFDALKNIVVHPTLLPRVLLHPVVKEHTEFAIFRPFAFLAVLSPLAILAIPLLAERFLSATPSYWVQMYHYTATIAPIVAMASADGLANVIRWTRLASQHRKRFALAGGVIVLALNLATFPASPLWSVTHPSFYKETATVAAGNAALAVIPSQTSVIASNAIVPHLTHRNIVKLLSPRSRDESYIIASISSSPAPGFAKRASVQQYIAKREAHGYTVVFDRRGWIVLRKRRRI